MQDPARGRFLDATQRCIARVGVAKTTLDDVAREAGCSRATLYRRFSGRDALVSELVAREGEGLRRDLVAAAHDADDLRAAVVALLEGFVGWYDENSALQFVLTYEPELVLPHIAFDSCAPILDAGSELVGDALAPHVADTDADTQRLGEWLTRMALSYLLSPSEYVSVRDHASVVELVDEFLVPVLTSRCSTPQTTSEVSR